MTEQPILILTPIKDAVPYADRYFDLLSGFSDPHHRISLGLLEGDTVDGSFDHFSRRLTTISGDRWSALMPSAEPCC